MRLDDSHEVRYMLSIPDDNNIGAIVVSKVCSMMMHATRQFQHESGK